MIFYTSMFLKQTTRRLQHGPDEYPRTHTHTKTLQEKHLTLQVQKESFVEILYGRKQTEFRPVSRFWHARLQGVTHVVLARGPLNQMRLCIFFFGGKFIGLQYAEIYIYIYVYIYVNRSIIIKYVEACWNCIYIYILKLNELDLYIYIYVAYFRIVVNHYTVYDYLIYIYIYIMSYN